MNASIIWLVVCLAATASAIGNREAIYVGGNVNLAYQRGNTKSFRPGYYGVKVSGRIDTSSESELVFDAGRRGALVIPYGAILSFEYSPGPIGNLLMDARERESNRVRERAGLVVRQPRPLPYPWSGSVHRAEHYYLGLELPSDTRRPGLVIFELGQDTVRPTLEALERRTGQEVALTSVVACAAYRGREACGWGDVSELKGRTRVFIHAVSHNVFLPSMTPAELNVLNEKIHADIEAVIEEARLGVTVVKGPEDADIILALRFFKGWSGSSGPGGTGSAPDEAVGEVYVAEGARLRVVMLFDEVRRFRFWGTGLVPRFAEDFVKAYKNANGLR